jgi:hypothetical protein
MRKLNVRLFFAVILLVTPVSAVDSDGPALKLVPAPKELELRGGGFRVGPGTRIVVQLGHQAEDRIAAETLAEQIADHSGLQLNIVGAKATHRVATGAIMLARLQDSRVRRFLARKGLRADAPVGDQGYLLFSDKSYLIVAANSGRGLFYGVQTLRQLLRPQGESLVCPAVTIRDWPSPENALSKNPHEAGGEQVRT